MEEELGDGPTMKKLDGKIRKVDPEFAMFDDDEMMEGQMVELDCLSISAVSVSKEGVLQLRAFSVAW